MYPGSHFKSLIKYAYKRHNNIDIIVNTAGVTHKPKFMEIVSEKEFDKVFNVNAKPSTTVENILCPK